MLSENLKSLETNIQVACNQSNRQASEIKILLASKTRDVETLNACISLGYSYFGENKVQEFLEKHSQLSSARWDFIGHLQSKKVKDLVGKVELIHSVDRKKLVDEIQKRATEASLIQKVLIEVNISGEATKSGVSDEELDSLLLYCQEMSHIDVCGLMTMATNTTDEEEIRRCFQAVAAMRERVARIVGKSVDELELSMGMSSDYLIAIEEGATIIRIGSSVFGART